MAESDHLTPDNFVVYAFSRSSDSKTGPKGSYYYIGKGKPNRPYTCSNRKTAKCPKDRKNHTHILHKNLTEDQAFCYEKELIRFYGRKDTNEGWGVLRNLTDGGEGTSGAIVSAKRREEISGKNSPHYIARYWSHPLHGFVLGKSISEILSEYKEENLLQSGLSLLTSGKIFSYKKWVFIPEKEIDFSLSGEQLSKKYGVNYAKTKLKEIKSRTGGPNNSRYISRDWCHPEYGLVMGNSLSELIKKFPSENLSASLLSNVISGKNDHHKGWIFIDRSLIDKSFSKEELNDLFSVEYAKNKIEEMSKIRRQRRKKSSKTVPVIPRNWYHPDHGVIKQTSVSEIVKRFSHPIKLNPSLLYAVAYGKRGHHRSWRSWDPGKGIDNVPKDVL